MGNEQNITGWKYKRKITINSDKVSGTKPLSDFILYFDTTDHLFSKHAQESGDDFLFTADDGKTKLSHEIDHWNPSIGRLIANVKLPVLYATKDTVFYLHYGNPDCENQENPSEVWSDYVYRKNFRQQSHIDKSANGISTQKVGLNLL
jgi:hypothetical protein